MKITIGQNEIEAAVKTYILSIMTLAEGAEINVDFSATRGPDGLTANINVLPPEVTEKAKEEQVVLNREPEKVTGSVTEPVKTTGRKPRTLAVEQKAAETTAAAQEEEPATIAQAEVENAPSEQQAASSDDASHDDQVDAAVARNSGFPGFEAEDKPEEQSATNDAGSTTAEPSTRKSLFGGLGRPSNH